MRLTWQEDVRAFLLKESTRPFDWGTRDCALFSARLLDLIWGTDYYDRFAQTYRSVLGAMKTVVGHGGLIKLVNEATGLEPVYNDGQELLQGDLVLVGMDKRSFWNGTLGVVIGDGIVVKVREGVLHHPCFEGEWYWRHGRRG